MFRGLSVLAVSVVCFCGGQALAWQQLKPATDVPAKAREEMERVMRERAAQRSQEAPPAAVPVAPTANPEPRLPVWTEPEFEQIGKMLSGSWVSGVGETGILIHITPVGITGLPNAMYCEVSAVGSPRTPFRQTVLTLGRVRDKVRLTTWEFRRAGGRLPSAVWTWAAPLAFPAINPAEDLIGTLSLDFNSGGGSYVGRTPHAYPTGTQGAVEMTSEIVFREGVIEVADRGYDGAGAQVWGPPEGTRTGLTRTSLNMNVNARPDGLTSVTMATPLTGPVSVAGDSNTIHYTGYLENGTEFDSSVKRGAPFTYKQGQPLIPGWNFLNDDLRAGMIRRIYVPSNFAWGAQGRTGQVPPNTNIVYEIEVLKVEPAPPPAPVTANPEAPKLEIKPVEGDQGGPPPVRAVPVPDPK